MSNGRSSEIAPSPRPASREKPRTVTRDAIEAFEKSNPALKGIGKAMLDMGIWVLGSNDSTPEAA